MDRFLDISISIPSPNEVLGFRVVDCLEAAGARVYELAGLRGFGLQALVSEPLGSGVSGVCDIRMIGD